MTWFAVHTEEIVHGVYSVQADSPEEAAIAFTTDPSKLGKPIVYEVLSAEPTKVENVCRF